MKKIIVIPALENAELLNPDNIVGEKEGKKQMIAFNEEHLLFGRKGNRTALLS